MVAPVNEKHPNFAAEEQSTLSAVRGGEDTRIFQWKELSFWGLIFVVFAASFDYGLNSPKASKQPNYSALTQPKVHPKVDIVWSYFMLQNNSPKVFWLVTDLFLGSSSLK